MGCGYGSGYFSITKVYSPMLLALREGGCAIIPEKRSLIVILQNNIFSHFSSKCHHKYLGNYSCETSKFCVPILCTTQHKKIDFISFVLWGEIILHLVAGFCFQSSLSKKAVDIFNDVA